jgi:competence protein ComEC
MDRPLFVPLFGMVLGISAAGILDWFLPEIVVVPFLALGLAAAFFSRRPPFLLVLFLLMFTWGNLALKPFIVPNFPPAHITAFATDSQVAVEGVIDSRPEATERGGRLYLHAEKVCRDGLCAKVNGRMVLYMGEGRPVQTTGDRVRFLSRIQRPRNYGLPGEFDQVRYLAFRNIFATAFVKAPDDIVLLDSGVEYKLQRRVDAVAVRLGRFIGENVAPVEGAVLRALLLGEAGYVPKTLKDAYTRTGVNHILSISGFHVGIISLFMFQLILCAARGSERLLLNFNLRRFALALTLPIIVFYLFLSGAAPATTRSVIMIVVYIMALLLEREVDPINSLALAAMLILAVTPQALFDISFQLSFIALWGILALTPIFMVPFKAMPQGVPKKLILFFMVSSAAIMATLVPVAYYFHRTTVTGLISNFIVVPLMGYGSVVIGFSALPFVYVAPMVAKALLLIAGYLVALSNMVITFMANFPGLPLFTPSRLDLALFFLALTALTFTRSLRVSGFCCGALLTVCLVSRLVVTDPALGTLKLTFFSIGQGESTLVTLPDGKRMLIDGGGSLREGGMDVGERLLAPALWYMGVDRIDYMVLSHPHPDHLKGLKFIAANFKVGEFWEGQSGWNSPDYLELRSILARRGVSVRTLTAATRPFMLGTVKIEPLAPFPDRQPVNGVHERDVNDDSLVFRLVAGEFAVLFTGDIGRETEALLALHPERLKCAVLKVAHHGSRHSSSPAFLKGAAPSIALISAGYHNSFNLPARETLDALGSLGIRVYRTDMDKTVQISLGPRHGNIEVKRLAGYFR